MHQKPSYSELERKIRDLEREREAMSNAHRELIKSEKLHRITLENISDAVVITDNHGDFVYVCPNTTIIFGLSQEEVYDLGAIHRLMKGPVLDHAELKKKREMTNIEWSIRDAAGRKRFLLINAKSVDIEGGSILYVMRDVTKRKQLEARSELHRKMEVIHSLVGGVAHDFNNILSSIVGCTETALQDELPETSGARHSLEQVLKASERAKKIVRQLRPFIRDGHSQMQSFIVGPFIKELLKRFGASLPSHIRIKRMIRSENASVRADPFQFHQVLMQLLSNAVHAMQPEGAALAVGIGAAAPETDAPLLECDAPGDAFLKLTVADTGPGVDDGILDRIFDPYFTTRPKRNGAGLGLPLAQKLAVGMGGWITAANSGGRGAVFTLYLPKGDDAGMSPGKKRFQRFGGDESLLLVDDEAPVLKGMTRALERLGYAIDSAAGGPRALDLLFDRPDGYALAIVDRDMPGMTGPELIREIRAMQPDLPVVLCTGHDEEAAASSGLDVAAVIIKPAGGREMGAVIRGVLDGDAGGADG